MNAQLQAAFVDILKTLQEGAQQAGSLAKEQLPLVIQEYLKWGMAKSCISLAADVLVLGVSLFFLRVCIRRVKDWIDDGNPAFIFLPLAVGIGLVLAIVWIFMDILTLVQIWVAPRVYLLEQLRDLLVSSAKG